jgi:hypothetical protein
MITSVKTGKKSDSRWTPKEFHQLLDLVDAEVTWPLIAITLARGVQAVRQQAQKLGHKVPIRLTTTPKWRPPRLRSIYERSVLQRLSRNAETNLRSSSTF